MANLFDGKLLPYWFTLGAAMVYATGFIIEFTFSNSLGIRDATDEPFKAKYIYVGFLCLHPPVTLIVFILGYFRIKKEMASRPANSTAIKIFAPSSALLILLMLTFDLMLAFSRPEPGMDPFHEHPCWFFILFAAVLWGLVYLRQAEDWLEAWVRKSGLTRFFKPLRQFTVGARWLMCLPMFGIFIYLFKGMLPFLFSEVLWEGGYFYVGFSALCGHLVWRILQRRADYQSVKLQITFLARVTCIVLVLGYLAVVTYAYRIYPFIPVHRGGGDFTTEAWSVITFNDHSVAQVPQELLSDSAQTASTHSKSLVVLRETPSTLYVATPHDATEVAAWRRTGRENKPTVVYALNRSMILSISYANPALKKNVPATRTP